MATAETISRATEHQPQPSPTFDIRAFSEADRDFVFSSWLTSFRNSRQARLVAGQDRDDKIGGEIYHRGQHLLIERLIERGEVLIACNPSEGEHLYGWICGEANNTGTIVHFGYVKWPFRKNGVFEGLVKALEDSCGDEVAWFTHLPPGAAGAAALSLRPSAAFNPYLAMMFLK